MRRIQTEALEALDGPCTFSVAALTESEMLARALARLHCSCLSQNFDDGLLDSEQREDERAIFGVGMPEGDEGEDLLRDE